MENKNKDAVVNPEWFATVQTIKQMNASIEEIVNKVHEGEIDALKVFVAIHDLEDACKVIREKIKANAVREADKYEKGKFNKYGHTLNIIEAGVSYDYSVCDKWKDLADQKKQLESELKTGWVDYETGEYVEAIKKPGTFTVSISKLK